MVRPDRRHLDEKTRSMAEHALDRSPVLRDGPETQYATSDCEHETQDLTGQSSAAATSESVKAGSFPIQRATGFTEFLKARSRKMRTLLATESMGYFEKVSGMWAGGRRHYGETEGLSPDDRALYPETAEESLRDEKRFRAHFALPSTENLQAAYFAHLFRTLPSYGKIYISQNRVCFRSLLPGTRTKMILPLHDIENVEKEKGFQFGYHGLVVIIRGHEELFFEFNAADARDDCAITIIQKLESAKFLGESAMLSRQENDESETADLEHQMIHQAHLSASAEQDLRTQLGEPSELHSVIDDPDESEVEKLEQRILQEARLNASAKQDVLTQLSESSELHSVFDDPQEISIVSFQPSEPLRITCLTIGSRGDVQPYIALCKGLLAEGHKPKIATHVEFKSWIRGHGIDFSPVDGEPAELMRLCVENGMFTYAFLREATSKFRGWIDDLLKSAWRSCQGSDVLIESPSAMAGIHIAEALGIPYFRGFTMPWSRTQAYPHAFAIPSHRMGGAYNYITYVMFDTVFWQAIAGQVNRWRTESLGLKATNLDKMQPNKVPFLYNFSPSVVPTPVDFPDYIRITGYWFLDAEPDYTAPSELLGFMQRARAEGKKLVYIGFGSIVVNDPAGLTQSVVDSVVKADVRCVLSKGWSARLDDPESTKVEVPLPPEVHQIKAAPHDWLFARMDAVVHHGGAGTTGASVRAGKPTIIKPFFGDQFFFGQRIADLGVGFFLNKINVSEFSRALWLATHDERIIVRAKRLGEKVRSVSSSLSKVIPSSASNVFQEDGVATAIKAIYRDLEYAKTLTQLRSTLSSKHFSSTSSAANASDDHDDADIEDWTLVGEESDMEFTK